MREIFKIDPEMSRKFDWILGLMWWIFQGEYLGREFFRWVGKPGFFICILSESSREAPCQESQVGSVEV